MRKLFLYRISFPRGPICALVLLFLSLLSGCIPQKKAKKIYVRDAETVSLTDTDRALKEDQNLYPPIVIMIHGTSGTVDSTWFVPPIYRFFSRKFRTPVGLKNLTDLGDDHAFVEDARELCRMSPRNFVPEHFYFFGWSGKLSFFARKQAARELYDAIGSLLKQKRYAHSPITLITHSHGGNVALNLSPVAIEKKDTTLHIKKLILLACPIQDETEKYSCDQIFGSIYNLYAPADFIQVADPQGFYRDPLGTHRTKRKPHSSIFSRREFVNISNADEARIIQAKIKFDGRSLYHIDFIRPTFFKYLPYILHVLGDFELKQPLQRTSCGSYCVNLITRTRK